MAAHWESLLHLEKKCGTSATERAVLARQVEAYRKHASWTDDAATLDAFAEIVAQFVEAKLDTGARHTSRLCCLLAAPRLCLVASPPPCHACG